MIGRSADVYKQGVLAARLWREDGATHFEYLSNYVGADIATTLPRGHKVSLTGGAVPPFFAGLLPEGRRLTNLRIAVKTSADDELSLLLAVGEDPVGDVQVVTSGAIPAPTASAVEVHKSFGELRFAELLDDAGMIDPAGLAGVQPKVSARMISLPVARAHERFILKLSPPEFPMVVENEAFFLSVARAVRMPVAKHRVVHDVDGRSGLLITRFDRVSENGTLRRLAVEDACQLLGLWPADKYDVTLEEVAHAVIDRCDAGPVAAREIYRQSLYAWLTGDGDVHAKNLSVLHDESGVWRVSPGYDLPSTLPYDDNRAALEMQGKKDGFTRRHFTGFAEEIGLPAAAATVELDKMLSATANLDDQLAHGALPFPEQTIESMRRKLAYRRKQLASGV